MTFKNLLKSIFDIVVINSYGRFFKHISSKRAILCYHRICKHKPHSIHSFDTNFITVDLLNAQLNWLSKFAKFVSLDEITDFSRENNEKKWQIAITFDDGYRDVLHYGLPLLEKYRIPAHIFISTLFVEDPACLPWWDMLFFIFKQWRKPIKIEIKGESHFYNLAKDGDKIRFLKELSHYFIEMGPKDVFALQNSLLEGINSGMNIPSNEILRKDDIQNLSSSKFITFGAHSVTHANLARCSPKEIQHEIYEAKEKLEEWTGKEIKWFAYPYGIKKYRNSLIIENIRKAKFKGALTTDGGYVTKNKDPFQIPRIGIDGNWKIRRFCTRVLVNFPIA